MCPQVPVSFVYGETDWMDPKAGVRVAASVRQSRGALSSTDCQVCQQSQHQEDTCVLCCTMLVLTATLVHNMHSSPWQKVDQCVQSLFLVLLWG